MIGRLASTEIGFQIPEVLPIVENTPMNGREISNAINNIRAMATEEGSKILVKHFKEFMEFVPGYLGTENGG